MSYTRLLFERRDALAILTFNEPEKRNPFSPTLIDELGDCLGKVAKDKDVLAVIFTGKGRAFSSGADLRVIQSADPMEDRHEYERVLSMTRLVWNYPKVTLAAVNGPALGLAASFVGWCDLAVAEESATFGFPEVRAGIASASVVPTLARVVGRKAMNELLLIGKPMPAREAWRVGLVNRVVPDGESMKAAIALAGELAGNTAHGIEFTKDVIRTTTDMEYNKALDYARDVRIISRMHPASQTRIDDYMARRELRERKD